MSYGWAVSYHKPAVSDNGKVCQCGCYTKAKNVSHSRECTPTHVQIGASEKDTEGN
jgi:hypothetical protein